MNFSSIKNWIGGVISHYSPEKYWKYRNVVTNKENKVPKILKEIMLIYIKKCDSFNCASLGTGINCGASFKSIPTLPHGLKNIIISFGASFGHNCTILHGVTIGSKDLKHISKPVFGDGVFIGAGAVILGNVKIGNNVKIGANAVVTFDVPDNCTVVGNPGRIIRRENENISNRS